MHSTHEKSQKFADVLSAAFHFHQSTDSICVVLCLGFRGGGRLKRFSKRTCNVFIPSKPSAVGSKRATKTKKMYVCATAVRGGQTSGIS
jgi:hypothetical protein